MPLYDPVVPMRYTAPLLGLLGARGPAARRAVLARAELDEALLAQPESLLSFRQFDALLTGLRELTGRSDLGFELGRAITRDMHGALGLAMQRCASMDEVLRLAARYSRLMSPSFVLQYRRQPRHGELVWRPAAGMSTAMLHVFYEIHVVSLYRLFKDALGERLRGYTTWMPMPRPPHAARYRELSRLGVHFGRLRLPQVRTVIDATLLDLPLKPARRPGAPDIGAAELSRLQGRLGRADRWSDWLRLMLRESEGSQPTQAEMAALLNLSAHTLARYLAREGASYRQLAVEIRHERACTLLRESSIGIGSLAQRLGYRDATNFSHAFRRLEGLSPTAYRAAAAPPATGGRRRSAHH